MIVEAIGWAWAGALLGAILLAAVAGRQLYRLGYREGRAMGYQWGLHDMGKTLKLSQDMATTFGQQALDDAVNAIERGLGLVGSARR